VLQSGANPSVDYFLRPGLEAASFNLPWILVDLDTAPSTVGMLDHEDVLVIICRYVTRPWLEAIEQRRARLKGVVLFIDDDLPAMTRDRSLPAATRGRILRDHVRHADRLSALASALWVTSPLLAAPLPAARVRLLEMRPTERPPTPVESAASLVVYHGGPTHGREQRFVAEIAAVLSSRRPDIRFELAGDVRLQRRVRSLAAVEVVPAAPWPAYRSAQSRRQASIMLAPLFDTAVNRARAPVKFLDATRMGAVGLYADGPVYGRHVRDGVDGLLLPMVVESWADAIEALIDAPVRRLAMARAAYDRVAESFETIPPLSVQDAA
jgi:glycosyltransferase involved in cell wall biosynthesis